MRPIRSSRQRLLGRWNVGRNGNEPSGATTEGGIKGQEKVQV